MSAEHPRKLYVVVSQLTNPWLSMELIEQVIVNSLRGLIGVEQEVIEQTSIGKEIDRLTKECQAQSCAMLFLSENIPIDELIPQLRPISRLKLLIPIYGNMTIETNRWQRLDDLLRGREVIFLVACRRQAEQLKRLVIDPVIHLLPYPVADHFLSPLRPTRPGERLKLVYAGRITAQKNILPLMEVFNLARSANPDIELHIAGSPHNLGYPLHGHHLDFAKFMTRFYSLIQQSQNGIRYHSNLSQNELQLLYDECDVFISMSTHHDEDFGVSCAQAICRGLKVILSDWGGHADHAKLVDGTLIPVNVDTNNIPQFSRASFAFELSCMRPGIDQEVRRRIHELGKSNFSQVEYVNRFRKILASSAGTYRGQTDLFKALARASTTFYPFNPENPKEEQSGHLYRSIYETYLADPRD